MKKLLFTLIIIFPCLIWGQDTFETIESGSGPPVNKKVQLAKNVTIRGSFTGTFAGLSITNLLEALNAIDAFNLGSPGTSPGPGSGSGNVNAANDFALDNAIIVSDGLLKNVKATNLTIDGDRIKGLGDPLDPRDAVPAGYIASQIAELEDIVLGENIVIDGNFDIDSSNWQRQNAVIENGVATINYTGSGAGFIQTTVVYEAGATYSLTADLTNPAGDAGNNIRFMDNASNIGGLGANEGPDRKSGEVELATIPQKVEFEWVANDNSIEIFIGRATAGTPYSFSIDNVIIRRVEDEVTKKVVIPTATWNGNIDLSSDLGVDDRGNDEATWNFSNATVNDEFRGWINSATEPIFTGAGLTFNQLPDTESFTSNIELGVIFVVGLDDTTIDYYYHKR